MTNWLIYHVASGQAFFTGVVLVIAAAIWSTRSRSITRRLAPVAFILGVIEIAVSATALPTWSYAVLIAAALAWIASWFVKSWRPLASTSLIAASILALVLEIPHHRVVELQPASGRSLTVVGDSISAGMGRRDLARTWPSLFAEDRGVAVQDLSRPGETVESALRRAMRYEITSPVVLVEIGGNDMLREGNAAQFRSDLDALLAHLSAPDRQIVMLELPLPPFYNEFGRVQRSLSDKYDVTLVPKRVLLSILTENGATVDRIHLSRLGHQRMAERVWQLVQGAFLQEDGG